MVKIFDFELNSLLYFIENLFKKMKISLNTIKIFHIVLFNRF